MNVLHEEAPQGQRVEEFRVQSLVVRIRTPAPSIYTNCVNLRWIHTLPGPQYQGEGDNTLPLPHPPPPSISQGQWAALGKVRTKGLARDSIDKGSC